MIVGVFDPGHNKNHNQGFYKKYYEGNANWIVCTYVKQYLEATNLFKIYLTKKSLVENPSLTSRGSFGVKVNANFLHSVHTNAYNKKTKGCMVFESVDLPDENIAKLISKNISKAVGFKDLGSRNYESKKYPGEDYLTVMDVAQDKKIKHVILSESGFHDNKDDCKILLEKRNLIKIAIAIGNAWLEVYNLKLKYNKEQISSIQNQLKCKTDGFLGPETSSAIILFQEKNNLKITGLPSDDLLIKIDRPQKVLKPNWKEILTSADLDLDTWEKDILSLYKLVKKDSDLGFLERFYNLPELIEKVHETGYKKGLNSK